MNQLPLETRFDGVTFDLLKDGKRLGKQLNAVRNFMITSSNWWTLRELEGVLGYPQASISARLRDLRKEKFGGFIVERRRKTEASGTYEYRCVGVSE